MTYFKSPFFLASFDKNISVDRVEGSATNRRLLDEEFQTIVASGAIIDFSIAVFSNF
jgi:hypothetical protein